MSEDSEGKVERRCATRYAVIMDAQVTDLRAHSTLRLRCSDISLSGCYLDTLNPMEIGTPLWIHLEHGQRVFECQARVTNMIARLGMGVAFVDPVPEDQLGILSEWVSAAASIANPQASRFGFSAAR
jgi:hypothetical protein